MRFTVIIPSRTATNLARSIAAVRRNEPGARIIVVDDGVDWSQYRTLTRGMREELVIGIKPFIFSRNCNLGIEACDTDVVLLNDDAMLSTPRGFSKLRDEAADRPEFGLISCVTNIAGNPAQRPQRVGLREEHRTVAFVCVYIPRRTIEQVGFLDERFTAYGWEDNDYCRRVRNAGLKLGIHDGCYVDHASLKSTFRGLPTAAGDILAGRAIYQQKWGDAR